MAERWVALSPERQRKYVESVILKWSKVLPFYQIEDLHTLTKRHGPFLVSITFMQSNYGYIPSFSIQSLFTNHSHRSKPFNKQLQSPEYFKREDYFNDSFSGFLSYFSTEETFDEAFHLFKKQIPLIIQQNYTLNEINYWFEYCIQGEIESKQPSYMLEHILMLRYFHHDELAQRKYEEYAHTVKKYFKEELERDNLIKLSEKQTFEYWRRIACTDLTDLEQEVINQLELFSENNEYVIKFFNQLNDFHLITGKITNSIPYLTLEAKIEMMGNLTQEVIKEKNYGVNNIYYSIISINK